MIKLSERLKLIADIIEPGSGVADIGTDHGYLPIYLSQTKRYGKIICTDVNKGPLGTAKANYALTAPEAKPDMRLGDGLDPLKPGEVETVVIAGMGGLLISDILEWDIGKSRTFRRFILQPRNNSGKLRKDLARFGFRIIREDIALEAGRYAEIITCEPGDEPLPLEDDASYDYPELLIKGSRRNVREYLESQLRTETDIMRKIAEGVKGTDPKEDPDYQRRGKRRDRIEYLLGSLDGGTA